MDSIIQSAIFATDYPTTKINDWYTSNIDHFYIKLDGNNKVKHLVRQSFFVKFCKLVYGDNLPIILQDYARSLKELIDLEYNNKEQIKYGVNSSLDIDTGFIIAKKFISNNEEDLSLVYNSIMEFFKKPLTGEPDIVPEVGRYKFIEMCVNFWHNTYCIKNKMQSYLKLEKINNIGFIKLDIGPNHVNITDGGDTTFFNTYEFKPELVNDIFDNSPIRTRNNLQCLSICLDWTNKDIIQYFSLFAKYVLTLDVTEIGGNIATPLYELQNLTNASMYQFLLKDTFVFRKDINAFIQNNCPKLLDSMVYTLAIVKEIYSLQINDEELLSKLCYYSPTYNELVSKKDDNKYAHEAYNASVLPKLIATEDVDADDTFEEENDETNDETMDDNAEDDGSDKTEDTKEDSETAEPKTNKEEAVVDTKKENDKTKEVVFKLAKEPTLDVILLRKEILSFISNTLAHPPEDVTAEGLMLLKNIKMYMLNIYSIETILMLISKVVKFPITFKPVS